jgi:hypothetical protein
MIATKDPITTEHVGFILKSKDNESKKKVLKKKYSQ